MGQKANTLTYDRPRREMKSSVFNVNLTIAVNFGGVLDELPMLSHGRERVCGAALERFLQSLGFLVVGVAEHSMRHVGSIRLCKHLGNASARIGFSLHVSKACPQLNLSNSNACLRLNLRNFNACLRLNLSNSNACLDLSNSCRSLNLLRCVDFRSLNLLRCDDCRSLNLLIFDDCSSLNLMTLDDCRSLNLLRLDVHVGVFADE